jgi:transcriptional regulator with XRE-family HTH domain
LIAFAACIRLKGENIVSCILNYKETGMKIYRAIEDSGLTYKKVAEKVGLESPRVIYEWTQGKKLPSLPRMVTLASVLSVEIKDLLAVE